jgi:Fe-S-cluster-containing dehydrogenase component/formate-dependent nitrite reductase membrane component NrfD
MELLPPLGDDGDVTQQAFVIDQRKCIGCHACTVACKVEHGVELGVFRTWVKYIERGEFPDTRRHFSVLRCNHCTNAPCVKACPVTALYKREDGIVDFDPDRCIGCKACMNACPYDALYIDPDSHTAAKCNFCAHRVELDMKPSCEVVCPVNAIISGDIEDPESPVSLVLHEAGPAKVRSPEQGTGPNVYYLGADDAALDPLAAAGGLAYLTTEVPPSQRLKLAPLNDGSAPATATTDIDHPPPWGWKVSSYFLTKGIAAGAMMLCGLLLALGAHGSRLADLVPGALALAGIAATGVFLVWDLKRPDRFYYLFTRPQWGSWLTRGAQVINVAALLSIAFGIAVVTHDHALRDVLRWPLIPAGAALAGYTAFLFGQCEGRDLWQSRLLLPHTIVNALLAGSAALGIAAAPIAAPSALTHALGWTVVATALAGAALIGVDLLGEHTTRQAERAARNLYRDRFAAEFWPGVIGGLLLPLALGATFLATSQRGWLAGAGACALVGLWLYEDAWVRAGQSVPLS